MARACIGRKWQVTIPIEVRRRYGFNAGDDIELIPTAKGVRLVAVKRKRTEFVGKGR